MSDTSQGPGWWQASDGKWYPPELYPKDWPKPNPAEEASVAQGDAAAAVTESTPAVAPEAAPAVAPEAAPAVAPEAAPAVAPEAAPAVAPEAAPAAAPEPAAEPAVAPGEPTASQPPVAAPVDQASAPAPSPETPPAAADAAAEWAGTPPSVPISPDPEPASAFGAQPTQPAPDQWGGTPDPAAGEPTLVAGVPPVAAPEAQAAPVAPPQQPAQPQADVWAPPAAAQTFGQPPVAASAAAPESSTDAPSGLLAILGGIALVVGSFLAWATAGGTLTSGNVNGLSGSNGWGTLICGLAVASGAALLLAGLRAWWVGAGIGVAALVAVGLVIFSITDIGSTSDDLPGVLRDAGVDEATASGAKLDLDVGIWIVAAGAAVSLIAGVVALMRRQN